MDVISQWKKKNKERHNTNVLSNINHTFASVPEGYWYFALWIDISLHDAKQNIRV